MVRWRNMKTDMKKQHPKKWLGQQMLLNLIKDIHTQIEKKSLKLTELKNWTSSGSFVGHLFSSNHFGTSLETIVRRALYVNYVVWEDLDLPKRQSLDICLTNLERNLSCWQTIAMFSLASYALSFSYGDFSNLTLLLVASSLGLQYFFAFVTGSRDDGKKRRLRNHLGT